MIAFNRFVVSFVALLCLGAAGSVGAAPPQPGAGQVVRRFALISGASRGTADRVPLRYAATDAQAIQHVLAELGGLAPENSILLLDVDRAGLRAGFDRLRSLVGSAAGAAPGVRTEIVFYYSGHSDETGLLLGGERVTYKEIRAWVEETGADVRIAVLDSCASGALTRGKGGVHRPPFLVDTSSAARGHAYLTASSENEAAQESDRLGAAYFTHYLVSGLRGAADVSRDGRVTLSEAYQYAFTETLARTETSRGGPQHASYDFQLSGKGDLVVTDLRMTSASLLLPPEMSGRLFVRNGRGQLVAEVHKQPAQPVELGLPPGTYRVTLDDHRRLSEASVELRAGQKTTLSPAKLVALVPAVATLKGGAPPDVEVASPAEPEPPNERRINFSLFPGADTNDGVPSHDAFVFGLVARSASLRGLSIAGAHYTDGDVRGFQLGYFGSSSGGNLHGMQLGGFANHTRGDVLGVQLASLANWARGPVTGAQLAGIVNGSGGAKGLGAAGIANLATGEIRGLQLAGITNLARGPVRGGLVAGIFNGADESVNGLQLAGVANLAPAVNGLQLAVVNVGGEIRGAQIGVVNVARRVRGAQIGIVNVAEDVDGVPFGLLSLVRNGIHELELATTDVGATVVSGVLGGRRFYTRLGFGRMAASNDIPGLRTAAGELGDRGHYLVQWGLGYRLPIQAAPERWFLDLEAVGTNYHRSNDFEQREAVAGGLRLVAGYRIAPPATLVFGASYTASVGWSGTDLAVGRDLGEAVFRSGETTVRLFPGLLVGLRI